MQAIDAGLLPIERARLLTKQSARRRALIMSVMTLRIPKYLVDAPESEELVGKWIKAGLLTDGGDEFRLTDLGAVWYNHMQIDVLPFAELISALRMFGSIKDQEQMLSKPKAELAGFERELLNLVSSRNNSTLRLLAYKTILKLHRLPGFDKRAIGFTGTIESDSLR